MNLTRLSRGFRWMAPWILGAMLVFGALAVVDSAPVWAMNATESGEGKLPWETPIQTLRKSISGPVAFAVALLGIIACGATLVWGGEISEFTRRIIYLILVIAVIVFANTLLTKGFSGALIPPGGLPL